MSISTVRSSMRFGHTDRGFHLTSHTAMTSGRLLILSGTELPCLQYACVLYRVCLCDPMDCSQQAPLSMGFPRQEYWRGLPFPPPWDLPDPWIKPTSLVAHALAREFLTTESPGKPYLQYG